ncbi:MAG TPA: Mut7-C RNAse domain-containing protein [Phototrophicaceae bacterium]|nr:Mut7-C RNAse domain-containing protein [Phototrophicaceae bacterium]
MAHAQLRFYAHLNDFLAYKRRQRLFRHRFDGLPSVKDMIESLGVPHTEVALILVNGAPVDFSYHVLDGDRISVYPVFEHLELPHEWSVQPQAAHEARFVADVHLGRLAAYLRMVGFDTLYPDDYRDEELARISSAEDRILLTRDRGLLKRRIVQRGYAIRSPDPWRQLEEVIKRFNLYDQIARFCRCAHCNGALERVDKAQVATQLPAKTTEYYDEFRRCLVCGKIYWRGSHYDQMDQFVERILRERETTIGNR